MTISKRWIWGIWLALVVGLVAWLAVPLVTEEDQEVFMAGEMSSGHHQIGIACAACHSDPFGGKEVLQQACVNCHGAELKAVSDSHPLKKFKDPRNADRVEKLDARYCVTCHVEHQLERTRVMGVTLPDDFCFDCHEDVGEKRDTHKGLGFDTCASAGCHNFHDNLALYEDFLLKHADEPWLSEAREVLVRDPVMVGQDSLNSTQNDAPEPHAEEEKIHEWSMSDHAKAGVNCSGCHQAEQADSKDWVSNPGIEVCSDCHESESDSFKMGKHGMRLSVELTAMSPAHARVAMVDDPAHDSLSCSSCHDPHNTDTQFAAVKACQGCHDSEHVRSYESSPHARVTQQAWLNDMPQSAVTCATCHMPRQKNTEGKVEVNHNQNENLRPNEKMIRPVCMSCHGLGFSIDALADPALIENNFNGHPEQHVRSIDMALERAADAPELDESYQ